MLAIFSACFIPIWGLSVEQGQAQPLKVLARSWGVSQALSIRGRGSDCVWRAAGQLCTGALVVSDTLGEAETWAAWDAGATLAWNVRNL